MLIALSIRDFVIIRRLDLDLAGGFTALTGETGAGKSIILSALNFSMGGKAEKTLVSPEADSTSICASFLIAEDHPVQEVLRANNISLDPSEPLMLRRIMKRGGVARGWINDQPVAAQLLRKVGALLIDIHGQFAGQGLRDVRRHIELLDEFAGNASLLKNCGIAWTSWKETRQAKEALEARLKRSEAERDWLTHAVEELNTLDPAEGEADALAAERQQLQAQEKVAIAVATAAQRFEKGGPEDALSSAIRDLSNVAQIPVFGELQEDTPLKSALDASLDALERALIEVAEAKSAIQNLTHASDFAPVGLERAETRLFALRAAGRKFDVDPDQLAAVHERMRLQLEEITFSDQAVMKAQEKERLAKQDYEAAANALSEAREVAGARLSKAIKTELKPLKLPRAEFKVHCEQLPLEDAGPAGRDSVSFQVRINAKADFSPLHKSASGGEMARLFLALSLCLSETGAVNSLIFDEVDVGVGGAVAAAIGERLLRMGERHQVLAITHSPQVAACAQTQLRISKTVRQDEGVVAEVNILDASMRTEEIARMLAGAEVSAEARAAADKLLALA